MGKLNSSYLVGASGLVGNIVVVNRGDQQFIRKRPAKSTKPRTPKQLLNMERFQIASQFIQSYKSFAKQYFGNKSELKSCYNLAISNILFAVQCNMQQLTIQINYPQIQFAKGNGLIPLPITYYYSQLHTVKIEWLNNAQTNPQNTDQLLILIAIDQEYQTPTLFLETQTTRAALYHEFTLPVHFQNKPLQLWIAFKQQNTTSNSVYLGKLVPSI